MSGLGERDPRPRGRARRQTTPAATAVVALALGLACAALVVLQDHQLVSGSASSADRQVAVVVMQLCAGAAPAAAATAPGAGRGERLLVRVVSGGAVVAASAGADEDQAPGGKVVSQVFGPQGTRRSTLDHEPLVVVHREVTAPDGAVLTVLAAQSLETVERATAVAITLLGIGYPLVLLVVAGTSWWLTGHTLRPVEDVRRRVDAVSATYPAARVPVPGSGDEIAHLATTMTTMLARLQGAPQAQRRFVADASHELRSPLATVRAVAEPSCIHPEALP